MNTVSASNIREYLETAGRRIDEELDRLLPPSDRFPPSIPVAMRYSVLAGGKRLRPIVCVESGRLLRGDERMPPCRGSGLALMSNEDGS